MLNLKKNPSKLELTLLLIYIFIPILSIFNIFNLSLNNEVTITFTSTLLILLIFSIVIIPYILKKKKNNLKQESISTFKLSLLNIIGIILNIIGITAKLETLIILSLIINTYVLYAVLLRYFSVKIKKTFHILILIGILIFSVLIGSLSIFSFKAFKYNNETYINTQKEIPSNASNYVNNLGFAPVLLNVYNGTMAIQLDVGDKTISGAESDAMDDIPQILGNLDKYYPRIKNYIFYVSSKPYFKGNIMSIGIDMNKISSIKNLAMVTTKQLKNLKGVDFYSVPLDTKPILPPKKKAVPPTSTSSSTTKSTTASSSTASKTTSNVSSTNANSSSNVNTTNTNSQNSKQNNTPTQTNNSNTSSVNSQNTTQNNTNNTSKQSSTTSVSSSTSPAASTSSQSSNTSSSSNSSTTNDNNTPTQATTSSTNTNSNNNNSVASTPTTSASSNNSSQNNSSSNYSNDDSSSSQSSSTNKAYEAQNTGNGYGIIKQLGSGYYQARLHSQPNSSSSYSENLTGGTKVKIINENSYDYDYVEAPDGNYGYVYDDYVIQN